MSRLFLHASRFQVYLTNFVQLPQYIIFKQDHIVLTDVWQLLALGIKQLINDRIEVLPIEVLEIKLTGVLDELHHLKTVTVCFDPELKFGLLGFDLGENVEEKAIHFVHEVVKVWATDMRVMINLAFNFAPDGLRANVVKVEALIFAVKSLLTDDSGVLAVWVDAHRVHLVAIGAFCSHQLSRSFHSIY